MQTEVNDEINHQVNDVTNEQEVPDEVPPVVPEPTKLVVRMKNNNNKPCKSLEIKNINFATTRVCDLKKAISRFHSQHPKVNEIKVFRTEGEGLLEDETYLDTILNDLEEKTLYVTVFTPFDWIERVKEIYINHVKEYVDFIEEYFVNWTVFGLILFWWFIGRTPFAKIFFGLLFLLHYLCLKGFIPIKFTYDKENDSKWKPLLTFIVSIYPFWDVNNPQHLEIIEKKEEDEKHDDKELEVHEMTELDDFDELREQEEKKEDSDEENENANNETVLNETNEKEKND